MSRAPAPGLAGRSAVEIVSIGNELLLGETVDTNTSWIARRLAAEGIRIVRVSLVGDEPADIRAAVGAALERTGTVICTGGLGPTTDDLTRDVVAELFGREQHIDDGWLDVLRGRYARRGIPMPAINRVQALRPEGAELLPNERGTAPGVLLTDSALGTVFLLPGVPAEMKGLLDEQVLPRLRERLHPGAPIRSRVVRTTGISEAALAERVRDVLRETGPLTVAFLPGLAGVDLRLTDWGAAPHEADAAFDRLRAALRGAVGDHIYGEDDVDLATVVGGMLRSHGLRLAVAESCTGGLLAKRLTDDAGASDYMLAAFVTYHNDAKRDHLGVAPETIVLHGAVSEQCAREMALGALQAAQVDLAVSVTGIAGPGGGSDEKPVGLVWFGLALSDALGQRLARDRVVARRSVFPGSRDDIRQRAAQFALDMMRRALAEPHP